MSTELCKLENDLCRCCHSEGAHKSINSEHVWLDIEKVVYSDMLRECFGIELTAVIEPLNRTLCTICDTCIQRLRDATEFKRQVQDCESRFRDQYLEHIGTVPTFKVEIKTEVFDPEDNDDVKVNIYSHNVTKNDGSCSTRAEDANISDDDFGVSDPWDEVDLKQDDAEDIKRKSTKETKNKKTKAVASKVKRKKTLAPPKAEDIVETIQGVINVVKRQPRIQLQEDIHYKRVGDIFKCCKCEKEIKSYEAFRYHIKRYHLKIPKYSCPNCSKKFSTLSPFTKHKLEEHDIDDRYKCNACDSIFNTRVQLSKHKNSFHMLGTKYKCNVCDYESFNREYLRKHKFNHRTVKEYHCTYCRKSFMRKSTLRFHERIHTGDKRKVCKECGQAFVQKASLNYHMTKYHPEVSF